MPDDERAAGETDQPVVYQIRLKGHLGAPRITWFEGMTITLEEDGNTRMTGPVTDQAALHGLLKKVRDLGIPLLSVFSVGTVSETKASKIKETRDDKSLSER